MKFKKGDLIKGKKGNSYTITNEDMTKARVLEIIDENQMKIEIIEHKNKRHIGDQWVIDNSDRKFSLLYSRKPTKQELLDMPIGTKIYTDTKIEKNQVWVKVIKEDFTNGNCGYINNDEINEDLTFDNSVNEVFGTKIIKIEEPTYGTAYDCETEAKEMTVAEIEQILGYTVKIVKEDK